jgi:chromosome segregation ATPase
MNTVAIQNALRIVVALNEKGLKGNLEELMKESELVEERQQKADKDLAEARKLVRQANADKKRMEESLVAINKTREEISALEAKSNKRADDLSAAVAKFNRDKEQAEKELADQKVELDKLTTAAKRAKTKAEKDEAKSEQIRVELEQRKARLEEAFK